MMHGLSSNDFTPHLNHDKPLVARGIIAQLCRLIAIFSARLAMSAQPLSRSTVKTRITTRMNAAKAAGWAFHFALKRRGYQPYPKFLV
jgi:hypothetical protein